MQDRKDRTQSSVNRRSGKALGYVSPRSPLLRALLLFALVSVGLTLSGQAEDVLAVGDHTFESLGVTYNDDGTSTWTYRVTSGSEPSLSHWVLELDPSLRAENVIDVSEDYTVGTDPKTHLYGVKFDEGYAANETRAVSFLLDASYAVGQTRVGLKADKDVAVDGPLLGPIPQVIVSNDPPQANDDASTTDQNTSVGVNVTGNDTDTDGTIDSTTVAIAKYPNEGSVSVHPITGIITYTPNPGTCGSDFFRYTVDDEDGATSNEAQVTVSVLCNDPPLAIDDLYTAYEGESLYVSAPGVLANDVDAPLEPLSAILVTTAAHGVLAINPDGSFTYVHSGSETSSDSFTYVANDGTSNSNVASVSIVIRPTNDPPQAADDTGRTEEDVAVVIDVLGNDSDPDADALYVDSVTQPTHGVARNNGHNVTYTPDPDVHGTDAFSYAVSDGNGGTDTAVVTVLVDPMNDSPIATADSTSTDEDKKVLIAVLDNDSDPDGDPLSVESVTQPGNGTVSIQGKKVRYEPEPGFGGMDAFTYTVSDGNGGTATAAVTVAVATENDPPLAEDDSATTIEDTPTSIPVLANDTDPDGDALQIESNSQPFSGTTARSGTTIIYTPDPNTNGTDAFTYTVVDGRGGAASATVTVTVVATNDPPVGQDDSIITTEDTPVTIAVLANDSDSDGDAILVESVTQPMNGTAMNNTVTITYIPDADYSGVDTFSYIVSDGNGGTDTVKVAVAVGAANDPPVAQDDSGVTEEGTLVTIPVLANDRDPDGDFLLVASFSPPSNGSVLNTRTTVSYIPNPGFSGIDAFRYTVSDGNGGTATATVTVAVAAVNDPPVAREDTGVTDEAVPVIIPVLLNDSDPDDDSLQIESVTRPANGAASHNRTEVTYTPNASFSGLDTFSYTVSDGNGGTDTGTIFVAVASVNDPPVAQNDSASSQKNVAISISVLANDSDPDHDRLALSSVTEPSNGTVTRNALDVTYTPNEGFSGTDSFTYTVSDGRGGTDTATVTVGIASTVGGGGGATTQASCDGRVIISEVSWAGTAADSQDEWIELRNLGTTPVDLTGWILRWRRTRPTSPEEQDWKVVDLSGILGPAPAAACDPAHQLAPMIHLTKQSPDDVAWLVLSDPNRENEGHYTIQRRHDTTISDVTADVLYDTARTLSLELSDRGEVITLVNSHGEIVDTANASFLGRDGWAAGSATTFGSMERVDPLKSDTTSNWHTNMGIITRGVDAKGRPVAATPGVANSPVLENLGLLADVQPATVRSGEVLQIGFSLPRQERRTMGWPWVSVIRPASVDLTGAGGDTDLGVYSFSGHYESSDQYVLDIGTQGLPPGEYNFWIVFGEGKALLVPIIVTP